LKFIGIKLSKNEIDKIVNKYSFTKIPQHEKGHGMQKRSASPGKWKENFNNEEKEIINDILGETLRKLRYE